MKKAAMVSLVVGVALWIPMSRALILFILPLGSGIDDLIFIIALLGGVALLAGDKAGKLPRFDKSRRIFVIILGFVIILSAIIYSML